VSVVPLEAWVGDGGLEYRRGKGFRGTPPDPPLIFERDLSTATVANPISAADFRYYIADPAFGDSANRTHIQVVNIGGAEGKVMRVAVDNEWYQSAALGNGVAYSNVGGTTDSRLAIDGLVQTSRMRFASDFETAKGGKCGHGVGGYTTTTAPVSPYSSPTYPVSGGNTSPYSWSVRPEWGADGKIHELCYLPLRANYGSGGTVYGIGRAISAAAHVKGDFFTYRRVIVPNTAYETDTTIDPRDLTQGVDYLADGLHQVWLGPDEASLTKVYEKTNEVFTLYAPEKQKIKQMFSVFRGGGDTTWNSSTTASTYFDFHYHKMERYVP
jgi:hypothetical protein